MPARSASQQRFMGLVRAVQEGKVNKNRVSKHLRETAENMTRQDAHDFAATKRKGLPEHVKKSFEIGFLAKAAKQGIAKESAEQILKQANMEENLAKYLINPAKKYVAEPFNQHVVNPVKDIPKSWEGYHSAGKELESANTLNSGLPEVSASRVSKEQIAALEEAKRQHLMRLLHGGGVVAGGAGLAGLGAYGLMGGGQPTQPNY